MERKCMMCGAELGEREKYCGNCGAKAPDGAVEKEEIEPKYITKEKPHEPWMDYSWKSQNIFCNLTPGGYNRHNIPLFCIIMLRFLVFGASFISTSIEDLKKVLGFMYRVECIVSIIFGILLCIIWLSTLKICDYLLNFKKNAPLFLYINCLVRAIIWWLYIGIIGVIGEVYIGYIYIAIFEFVCGISALMISIKYYGKRKFAFIN